MSPAAGSLWRGGDPFGGTGLLAPPPPHCVGERAAGRGPRSSWLRPRFGCGAAGSRGEPWRRWRRGGKPFKREPLSADRCEWTFLLPPPKSRPWWGESYRGNNGTPCPSRGQGSSFSLARRSSHPLALRFRLPFWRGLTGSASGCRTWGSYGESGRGAGCRGPARLAALSLRARSFCGESSVPAPFQHLGLVEGLRRRGLSRR